jgi:uncharacterized protein (TIGR02147 family)
VKTNVTAPPPKGDSSGDFRARLQEELARRCAGNPWYSLRAFARDLGTDHATLSQLLRAKRRLTAKSIEALGARLRLSTEEIDRFQRREEEGGEPPAASRSEAIRQLTQDTAVVLSEWYHYAILELVRLAGFQPDTRWIARVLDLTTDEVNVAVSRLLRLRLLEMGADGRWIDRSGDTSCGIDGVAHATVKRLFEQVRAVMLTAMQKVPPGLRVHGATTLAVHSSRLPAAMRCIERFRRELTELLERDEQRDDVYQLEISFFPLTTLKQTEEFEHGPTRDPMADPVQGPRQADRVLHEALRLEGERGQPARLPQDRHRVEAGDPGRDLALAPGGARHGAALRRCGRRAGLRAEGGVAGSDGDHPAAEAARG